MAASRRPDVLILGGGVIGAACAYDLARTGRQVVVVEPGPLNGAATAASAGMLAPMVETDPEYPLLYATVRARDLSLELIPELEEKTGVSIGLECNGILHVRFTAQEAQDTLAVVAWQRQQGFSTQWLSEEEVRQILPGVGSTTGAAYAPEDANLDPTQLRKALLEGAVMHGARVRLRDRAEALVTRRGRITAVRTQRAPSRGISAGAVLIAGGCWSGQWRGLPRPLPVEPVRGQVVVCDWPPGTPPAVAFGTGGYIVHRRGRAIVGSTMERAGFDWQVTDAGRAHLKQVAAQIFPALADATELDAWAGLRPVTPDGLPVVGPDPEIANLWYATGHGRNGILLAILTGEIIRLQMSDVALDDDLRAVRPSRLWK